MRKHEVLSMTIAPAFAARGANAAETLLPGDDSTMSMPLKLKVSSAWIWRMSSSPNETSLPTDRDEASATTSSAGKLRSARVVRNSRPTLPVAPTTATLKPICKPPAELESGWECSSLLTYDAARRITSGRSRRRPLYGDELPGNREAKMATVPLIDESAASAEVRAVFDDIRTTRKVDWINNFWRALANHPPTLRRIWQGIKEVMAPGALDPLTKEMVYLAVSISNGCTYCTASHGAAAKRLGMNEEMLGELIAVVGMANQTNRLADGYRVPVDERFENLF